MHKAMASQPVPYKLSIVALVRSQRYWLEDQKFKVIICYVVRLKHLRLGLT